MKKLSFGITRTLVGRWFPLLCLAVMFYALPVHAEAIRIMAVGDSITAGYTDNRDGWTEPFAFGYRGPLYTLLTDAGYDFDFVGSSTEPWLHETAPPESSVTGFDLRTVDQDNHNGYGGAGISSISSNIVNWMTADNPDVILLMIGINNITNGSTGHPSSVESGLNSLVNTIVTTDPEVNVVVAQITPYSSYTDAIVQYNSFIVNDLVPAYQMFGYNVTTVNQYDNLLTDGTIDPTLFSNGINHPTNAAYADMAATWLEGIDALGYPHTNTGVGDDEEGLVANGSFEDPTYTDPHHDYAGGIVGSGWTPTGRAGIDRANPYGPAVVNCGPIEGSQMGFLSGDAGYTNGVTSLSQEVSGFTIGESYTLSFYAKGMDGYGGVNPFRVSLGGVDLTFDGVDLLSPGTVYEFCISDPIIAAQESMILKFYDEGNVPGQQVSWIDKVEFALTSVGHEVNLVDNYSFESRAFGAPVHNYQTVSDLNTQWTYEGRAGIGRDNIFGAAAPNCAAADGSQMGFLQGDVGNTYTPAADGVSKLMQEVSGFEIGKSYILSFMAMGMDGYSGPNPFYVSIEGKDLFGLITPTLEYQEYVSDPFTATAETMSLLFRDQGNIAGGFVSWIDYVRVVQSAIQPVKVPGDANNDGKVDGSDVTILAGNWQVLSGASWEMGDFNGDGKVDGSDVTILAGNWQHGVSTAAASVPEPAMLAQLALLLGLLAAFRRKRS